MPDTSPAPLGSAAAIADTLATLARTIDVRIGEDATSSYTAYLLEKGPAKLAKKIIEEGGELGLALVSEEDESVANEAADLLYHLLVALCARGITLDQLAEVLTAREGTSGHEEKAGRSD